LVAAQKANALGDYLRARPQRLRPEDVGFSAGPRRRVPGLRRESLRPRAVTRLRTRTNFLRWRLLEPAARELFVDWDESTEIGVSG
jgi:hypothetical protein